MILLKVVMAVLDFINEVHDCPPFLAAKFLFARKFNIQRAVELYKNYVKLVRLHELQNVHINDVLPLLKTKSMYLPDSIPGEASAEDILKLAFYLSEAALSSVRTQRRGFTIIMNMQNVGWSNYDTTFQDSAFKFFQNNIPASIRNILIYQAPWWVNMMLKVTNPFLKQKIKDRDFVEEDQLPVDLGGNFEYDHESWIINQISYESKNSKRLDWARGQNLDGIEAEMMKREARSMRRRAEREKREHLRTKEEHRQLEIDAERDRRRRRRERQRNETETRYQSNNVRQDGDSHASRETRSRSNSNVNRDRQVLEMRDSELLQRKERRPNESPNIDSDDYIKRHRRKLSEREKVSKVLELDMEPDRSKNEPGKLSGRSFDNSDERRREEKYHDRDRKASIRSADSIGKERIKKDAEKLEKENEERRRIDIESREKLEMERKAAIETNRIKEIERHEAAAQKVETERIQEERASREFARLEEERRREELMRLEKEERINRLRSLRQEREHSASSSLSKERSDKVDAIKELQEKYQSRQLVNNEPTTRESIQIPSISDKSEIMDAFDALINAETNDSEQKTDEYKFHFQKPARTGRKLPSRESLRLQESDTLMHTLKLEKDPQIPLTPSTPNRQNRDERLQALRAKREQLKNSQKIETKPSDNSSLGDFTLSERVERRRRREDDRLKRRDK
ncbi:hypothetical protein ROZALSC1DRAFT_26720 [Rozella allomycis CSF55]|uniref:CRAL-TRIO domain-containing protein n=1 Tax=Rozella allomycis (strain CSF55) TaxID=988480 RepID=A0A075AMJ7_ROZAC|nr:CRAL-TRIO domain-containing protein [Rozella allomycis CSF55]RKP21889.1 hypothetical protein ROZALSC1DRAFT_26720 [Rozella allomycis CSF55]|eukprot:EPZ30833.1 CRAL-TRIO domain-containing protein [Rozella allomycis CSF55]